MMHLLSAPYSFIGVHVSQLYKVYIDIWLKHYGILKFLRSCISKTIYLIAMKFTDVMEQMVESLNLNFQGNLDFDKSIVVLII